MKITPVKPRARERAWALLVVMALAATGLLLVASVIAWANENAAVTARNSEYFTTTYAAEAATEKALGAIVQDDQNYGEGLVLTRSSSGYYNTLIPSASDSSYWTNYQFSGGTTNNIVIVECVNTSTTNVLGPPYSGLQSVGATYEIVASAKNDNSMYGITATVGQQVGLGQIPIFQFAIFYNNTLEIDPGANMTVNGLVHGNTNIYIDPNSGVTLTFTAGVSATGTLNLSENPLDPSSRPAVGTATFDSSHLADVNPLNLPVGTNVSGNTTNTGANVAAILQVPPAGESPGSATGTNRLYNQVDMIITVSNGNIVTVTSGVAVNNAATTITNPPFVSTNGSFYNMRDGAEVAPVNIDVGQLRQWSATNTVLAPLLTTIRGGSESSVQSIFVVDQRYLSNAVVTTNYSYVTNTTTRTTASYPSGGTYFPPVTTNTTVSTSSSFPGAGTYVPPILSTNLTSTTTLGAPGSGTYVGSITTNTTTVTTATHPNSGSYLGTITTNGSGSGKTYTYNEITSYTYNIVSGYIYNEITGYTYAGITGTTTNITYTTNLIEYAEPGVVLTNGGQLPPNGLSVATPDPLYIVGNWNVSNSSGQSLLSTQPTSVVDTLPSAVFADAVTILSPSWNPNNSSSSSSSITTRTASQDVVNCAILTGNVPSNGTYYSGGVENFVRLQENWSGVDLYYNGSMVEMFQSQIANYPWPGTGTVYNPPDRIWAFDTNFSNPSQLPPLTPKVIYLNRARWSSLTPGATWF
jgi:hypothetical protein